jgi:hypothetical protein
MQTSLRIDGELYREAKAQAAREGVTLTLFIEEALAARLGRVAASGAAFDLPSYRCGPNLGPEYDLLEEIGRANEGIDQELESRFHFQSVTPE